MTEVVFSGAVTTIVILVGLLVVDSHFDADRIDSTPVKFGIERRFVLIIHYTLHIHKASGCITAKGLTKYSLLSILFGVLRLCM